MKALIAVEVEKIPHSTAAFSQTVRRDLSKVGLSLEELAGKLCEVKETLLANESVDAAPAV